jgi:hypothetical protein
MICRHPFQHRGTEHTETQRKALQIRDNEIRHHLTHVGQQNRIRYSMP